MFSKLAVVAVIDRTIAFINAVSSSRNRDALVDVANVGK